MRALSIMYHDVVEAGADDSSGFPGSGSAPYKLTRAAFEAHLAGVAAGGCAVESVERVGPDWGTRRPVFLTFDDGGVSFDQPISTLLEARGWTGHFFITTDWIGREAFLNAQQIRELRSRGHVIGSHSRTHPTRMAYCTRQEMLREWRDSVRALEDILGEPVTVASVPGGYYSRAVAETAAEAGIRILFNSEPATATYNVNGCVVLGRYFIQRSMPDRISADFAAGRWIPRAKQAGVWKLKKAAKLLGGAAYLKVRERLLRR